METLETLDQRAENSARKAVLRILWNKNRDAVEDVLQSAKLQAFRKAAQYTGQSSFGTWFYRIASNEALQFLRDGYNRKRVSDTDEEVVSIVEGMQDPSPNPEELYIEQERKELLRVAMLELSPILQKALLKYIDPNRNTPVTGPEKANLFRARAQLRALMQELGVY